ncbi:MAG: shikimate dehydrogenase [Pseudonocardiales bacterium]|nr:shikimate dehydrogenase [Pseudonocardiales bacterium]
MPDRYAGVLGRPIGHSLSPVLHRAAYAELGLDWGYKAVDCGVAELADVLAARADWAGFSATRPLKHAVLDVAAEVRPVASAVGAANTLLPGPSGWIADNTDVAGIVAALAEHAVAPRTVTVLGAGGTAQALLAALLALGVADCTVLLRDATRAVGVLDTAERLGVTVTLGDLDPRAGALDADLVVSTLPPGAADRFAGRAWSPSQAVLDVVYALWPSPLAAAAGAAGAKVVSGALMLLHQAAAQVAVMTGEDPPVDAMRAALEAAAPGCGV